MKDREAIAELFRDSSTLGSVLLALLLKIYGETVLEADPVELYLQVQEDFHATITEEGENRLNAIILALTTNEFYENPAAFQAIAASLYDGDLGDLVDGAMGDITLPEILWAVYEVGLVRDDDEEPEFAPAVQRLIDEEVAQAAEELDMEDTDAVVPYYERFVEDMKQSLDEQLKKAGLIP